MPPIPAGIEGWRAEIAGALAEARGAAAAADDERDAEFWHRMEDRAIALARGARGLPALRGSADQIDAMVDEITDLTERLRRHAPGDPDDHRVSEEQFFLLYYLGAQVHAGAIPETTAAGILTACWGEDAAEGEPDDGEDEDEGEDEDDDDVDPPWQIERPAPATPEAWLTEVIAAWREAARPPPLRSAEGRPVLAAANDLREAAVILALHRRGARPPAEAVYGLIGVIDEMERDIAALGPELSQLRQHPPLAFVLYYVWTHILIGHADEDAASAVVREASAALDRFAGGGPARQPGSSRFRRPN